MIPIGLLRQPSSADSKEREKQATDQGFAMLLLSSKATMNLNHNNNHLHYPYTRLIQRFPVTPTTTYNQQHGGTDFTGGLYQAG